MSASIVVIGALIFRMIINVKHVETANLVGIMEVGHAEQQALC
jgi:hypothetical protein